MASGTPLSSSQKAIIAAAPFPLYQAVNVAATYPEIAYDLVVGNSMILSYMISIEYIRHAVQATAKTTTVSQLPADVLKEFRDAQNELVALTQPSCHGALRHELRPRHGTGGELMRWLGIGLAVVALALPGVAIAETMTPGGGADTWTFYGYGNGYALAQILEAITLQKIAMYFAGMLLTVYMLFSLKVDIFVEDMVWDGTGSPQFTQRIDGVPAAIGLPAVVISEIGMWATSSIEANFTTPNFANLRLSEGAPVGMAANMLNDMKNIRLTDPYLRSSIQSFMNDCALPNIFNGSISPVTLITSQNAWSVLGSNLNPAVYTVVYDSSDPNGGMEACDTAYTKIDNRLQTAAPSLLNGMGESSPFWLQQAAGSTALSEAALEDSFRWASGGSVVQDATGLATQAARLEGLSNLAGTAPRSCSVTWRAISLPSCRHLSLAWLQSCLLPSWCQALVERWAPRMPRS